MQNFQISVTPVVTEKKVFNELVSEAQGLGDGGKGRQVILKPVSSNGRDMIYISVQGKNIGMAKASEEEKTSLFPLLESGCYMANLSGEEEKRKLIISIEETAEAQVAADIKSLARSEKEKLENLIGKEETEKRLSFMAGFGLTEKLYPKLFLKFMELVISIISSRKEAGLGLIPEPATLFITHNKKSDANALLTMAQGMVAGRSVCLEGPMARGKNVAWESMAWLTCCEQIRLQWDARTNKGSAFCHESTDNEAKNSMTVERLADFLSWLVEAFRIKIFRKKPDSEEGLKFGLDVIKSMSPSLKMVNGPILEALELANRGIGVILLNDELNLGDPNTVSGFLNDLMDGHSPSIYVAGVGEIPINHDRLFIGATQNGVGGDYIGTRKQNIATMSRLQTVIMEGSSSVLPILRTAEFSKDVSEEDLLLIDKIYKEFDRGVTSGEYPESSLNIRGFKGAVDAVALGKSVETAIILNVINGIQDNNDRDMLKTVVDTLL